MKSDDRDPRQPYDLVVSDAEVVGAAGTFRGAVGIRDGRIAALSSGPLDGRRTIDAKGRALLPGVVDAHCHFRIVQGTGPDAVASSDDYRVGPMSAAFGGVTTFIDFAIQPAGVSAYDNFVTRRRAAESGSVIDFGFHCSLTQPSWDALDEIDRIMDAGVCSFKFFMAYRKWGFYVDHGFLVEAMRRVGRRGGVCAVHAEDDEILEFWREHYGRTDPRNMMNHSLSRPELAEELAVRDAIRLSRDAGAELYVVHVSTAVGLDTIVESRRAGQTVRAETCPHYLAFSHDVYAQPDGRYFTMTPPLRAPGNSEALWKGVERGDIDVIASDHNSFTRTQKEVASSFLDVPPGLAGIEMLLPFVLSEGVNTGRISLQDAVRLLSTNPARIYHLGSKGSIEIGKDADLVLVDLNEERLVTDSMLHDPNAYTVFAGRRMKGWPVMTISRGDVIVEDGACRAEPGRGRFVARF
ncbi:MAG: amidohydrolase family protein [Chloroflexi bacterium]|nr:amidohydrolase family protein [Chloroflexota bacterium]